MIRARIMPLVIVVLAIVAMAVALEDFAERAMATPILYAIWIGRLILESLPQDLLWTGLVLALGVLACTSLLPGRRLKGPPKQPSGEQREGVRLWATWLSHARHRDYFRWRLARGMAPILREALIGRLGITSEEMDEELKAGGRSLPREVGEYLLEAMQARSYREYLEARQGRWRSGQPSALDTSPERIVQLIEEQLELPSTQSPRQPLPP